MGFSTTYRNGLTLLKRRLVDKDEAAGFGLAVKASAWLYPPYRFSEFGQTWLQDEEFTRYLDEHVEPERRRSADRLYFLQSIFGLAAHLPGEIAECGSYQGASALLLCRSSDGTARRILLFDSFRGLSEPVPADGAGWKEGDLAAPREVLEARLAPYADRVEVYEGWIPDRFPEVADRTFCFLHVDVDLYQPTMDSLDFFYPRLVSGGVAVFDDYGLAQCIGQQRAVDEFFADRPEPVVHVPTGQAFVIKQ